MLLSEGNTPCLLLLDWIHGTGYAWLLELMEAGRSKWQARSKGTILTQARLMILCRQMLSSLTTV